MNEKPIVLFILLLIVVSCKSPSPNILDIGSLCQRIGPNKSIIGLGESTHGTKEFTKHRAQIVQELVEKYDFRIFILEAEYIVCTNINNYILNGEGDPKGLLSEIKLWPWNNHDFLELIIWMKEFNLTHKTDPIQFFGMDTQFYNNYVTSSNMNFPKEFIDKYNYGWVDSLMKQYPIKGKLILEINDGPDNPEEKIKKLRNLSEEWASEESEINLNLQYSILARIQNHSLKEPKNLNIRDQNMAKLVELIYKKMNKKVILWAHNEHIFRKNDLELNYISSGHHISKIYKDQYSVIGFDFREGSFNAKSRDEINLGKNTVFQYKRITETLSNQIDFEKSDYKIVDCSTIKTNFQVNSIGATYKSNPQDVKRYTSQVHSNIEFDFIFNVLISSPTELLGVYN